MSTTTTIPAPPIEKVYKVAEAADLMQVHPVAIYNLIRAGSLRAVRIGKLIRIPESALIDFIEGGGGDTTQSNNEELRPATNRSN